MKYSPLCDTDLVAYLAYIASANCDGSSTEQSPRKLGGGRVNKNRNSSDDDGSRVVGVFRGLLEEARRGVDEVDRSFAPSSIGNCIRGLIGDSAKRSSVTDAGLAGGDDGHCDSGVGDGVCPGRVREVECGPRLVPVLSNAPVVNVSERTAINRAKRAKGKARRDRKRAARQQVDVDSGVDLPSGEDSSVDLSVPEWRRGVGDKPIGWQGAGSGFWNSCSQSVRQQLIDSKARMHIAENERKAAEARNRVEYLDSPRAIADQVVKLATQLEKQTGLAQSNAVAGWAQTVISSSAESIAKSAPSSAPSFDSYITDRSEREAKKAAEELAVWEEQKKKDDDLVKQRQAKETQDIIDAEVKLRCETEIHNRVAEQVKANVAAQVKLRVAELEAELAEVRQCNRNLQDPRFGPPIEVRTGRRKY